MSGRIVISVLPTALVSFSLAGKIDSQFVGRYVDTNDPKGVITIA